MDLNFNSNWYIFPETREKIIPDIKIIFYSYLTNYYYYYTCIKIRTSIFSDFFSKEDSRINHRNYNSFPEKIPEQ